MKREDEQQRGAERRAAVICSAGACAVECPRGGSDRKADGAPIR
jgi:hypothetical protein